MLILELYIFVLAGFVGFMVITRVPPLLHTPLMSATNAISGISLVGSMVAAGAETAGGYARAQSEDEAARTRAALANHIKDMDLVVTTAQIPGRAAPKLITADMVASMRPGSVIVDLAAESGGNCELTLAGETVQSGNVTIIGPLNVPGTVPFHASQMFGKNILALVTHLSHEGSLHLDRNDEITSAMTVVRDGQVVVNHSK